MAAAAAGDCAGGAGGAMDGALAGGGDIGCGGGVGGDEGRVCAVAAIMNPAVRTRTNATVTTRRLIICAPDQTLI